MLAGASPGWGAGSLEIPSTIDGYPTNVGLLVIGHSTSAVGDYPAKLVAALNHPGNAADGRHYVAFNGTHGGDGGFLWSRISVPPTDLQYNRVKASIGPTTDGLQWCEDSSTVRWSCRRAKIEKILTGTSVLPTTGSCGTLIGTINPQNVCSPGNSPAAMPVCTFYDRTRPLNQNPVSQPMSFNDCWKKMDYHVGLIQDTTNRSWPIDDYTGNGLVDSTDFWPSSRIKAEALPCGSRTGVVNGSVDWNCDGALTAADAAHTNYVGWMQRFVKDLVDPVRYGAAALEHVFVTHKPLEMGGCTLYPASEQAACANKHAIRTAPQIAATPSRPLDHYYLPTVYWEWSAIERLFVTNLDPRLHRATPDARAMWNRSVKGYTLGLVGSDWTIPATVPGRPTVVTADDQEIDGVNPDAVGTMNKDHIHHNEAGGWMMADVWFGGLKPYLQ